MELLDLNDLEDWAGEVFAVENAGKSACVQRHGFQ
jgi:hypothetical protein